MSYFPPVPTTDFMSGQLCYIAINGFNVVIVNEHNYLGGFYDLVADGYVVVGPGTATITLVGGRIPCKVSVTVNDSSGGPPGVDTTTDYNFGPSLISQNISLATSDDRLTLIAVKRRF